MLSQLAWCVGHYFRTFAALHMTHLLLAMRCGYLPLLICLFGCLQDSADTHKLAGAPSQQQQCAAADSGVPRLAGQDV
jgi:hypothetical protein